MSRDILLSLIDADPEQPRKHFDAGKLAELAQSMEINGLAVPILVRPVDERFLIVHGERRFRAALSLGWDTIAGEVREMTSEEARRLALIENVQRADLSPIEEAQAYQGYIDQGMTQTELGKLIGKSQSYIAGKLRYMKLSQSIQGHLDSGEITEGHAKQLLRLHDSGTVTHTCERLIKEGWSVHLTKSKVDGIRLLEPGSKATFLDAADFVRTGQIAGWDVGGVMAREFLEVAFLVGDILNLAEKVEKVDNMPATAWWLTECASLGEAQNVLFMLQLSKREREAPLGEVKLTLADWHLFSLVPDRDFTELLKVPDGCELTSHYAQRAVMDYHGKHADRMNPYDRSIYDAKLAYVT
jgi:ParB/RepB/Spo0J family partition protein